MNQLLILGEQDLPKSRQIQLPIIFNGLHKIFGGGIPIDGPLLGNLP